MVPYLCIVEWHDVTVRGAALRRQFGTAHCRYLEARIAGGQVAARRAGLKQTSHLSALYALLHRHRHSNGQGREAAQANGRKNICGPMHPKRQARHPDQRAQFIWWGEWLPTLTSVSLRDRAHSCVVRWKAWMPSNKVIAQLPIDQTHADL